MKIFSRLGQKLKNVRYEISAHLNPIQLKVAYDVPYVCQFAKPEHAELSLKKELRAIDDPEWRESGATSPERYAEWAFTMCGMASAAMALEHFKGKRIKPAELAEDALVHGVYVQEPAMLSSMKYKEFSEWLPKYELHADVYTRLSVCGIRYALSEGCLVIVSVNPNVRGYDTAPKEQKGGHLVLVVGYDLDKDTITINNPSGFVSTNTQLKHVLPTGEFLKYYAGRGIVVKSLS